MPQTAQIFDEIKYGEGEERGGERVGATLSDFRLPYDFRLPSNSKTPNYFLVFFGRFWSFWSFGYVFFCDFRQKYSAVQSGGQRLKTHGAQKSDTGRVGSCPFPTYSYARKVNGSAEFWKR